MRAFFLAILFMASATVAQAVLPDEVLSDPVLEARARAISAQIRCPVCQGESIDESNAGIARDLRLVLRERLVAGDSDEQVIDFLVSRYGEFVLFMPRANGANLILWAAGPVVLGVGLLGAWLYLRRRKSAGEFEAGLSADEEKQLATLLKE